MKLALALFTFCLILKLINCSHKNVTSIEVKPCPSSEVGVKLWSRSEKMVVQNLSLCLRFRIQSWSSSFYLVKSDSVVLIISPYDPKHLGYLWFSNHDNYFVYAFGPKKYLSFSTSVWNSICLAYSISFQSLTIVVNGKTVTTQIQKRS